MHGTTTSYRNGCRCDECRAANKVCHRSWVERTGYSYQDANLRKKYGVTLKWFEQQIENQEGLCAICEQPPADGKFRVDHNHETGEVRELLCGKCNVGLWAVEDTPLLTRMLAYLDKHT